VIISPSLPSIGTILNNGTWASPTILGSTKGQYTYREFNPFLTSATQSETYSPTRNIACLQKHLVLLPDGSYSSAKKIIKTIEGKKHMTELKNKFDMSFSEINHKIKILPSPCPV
jgi:hypothetical protein